MLAEGLAGELAPEQKEFCEQIEEEGLQLMPFLAELSRRAHLGEQQADTQGTTHG